MTKREKRVKKLFQNPKTVPFKELDRVLKDFGFKMRQPGSGSSHYVYTKDSIPIVAHFANIVSQNELTNGYTRSKFICKWYIQISVPFRRPFVKEVYVKRVLELLGGEDEEKS